MNADERLRAQLERLRSDDWLRDRAREATALTPQERLRRAYALCRAAMRWRTRPASDRLEEPDAAAASALRLLANTPHP